MRDPNSVANILSFSTKHISLLWDINFEASRISGSATLTLVRTGQDKSVKLDCSHLVVKGVKNAKNEIELNYKVDPNATKFGGLLEVDLSSVQNESIYEIKYLNT